MMQENLMKNENKMAGAAAATMPGQDGDEDDDEHYTEEYII